MAEIAALPFLARRRGGRPLNPSTVWRWHARGVRGIRLETGVQGGLRVTTAEAVERFFDRVKVARDGDGGAATATMPRTPTQRRRASERAGARLRGKGI
jgi:hypothetical protein